MACFVHFNKVFDSNRIRVKVGLIRVCNRIHSLYKECTSVITLLVGEKLCRVNK